MDSGDTTFVIMSSDFVLLMTPGLTFFYGGTFGALCTGLFYRNPKLFFIQLLSVLFTIAFSGIMTYIIIKGISYFTNLRILTNIEHRGLDYELHGENAYTKFIE